jgi:hypothetical protein
MKTESYKIAALIALVLPAYAFSAVVVDDAAILPYSEGTSMLTLTQSIPEGEGMFAISISSVSTGIYKFEYLGIAEEFAFYSSTLNAVINPVFVASTTPLVSNDGISPGSSNISFSLNQTKLFAYWDDRNFDGLADSADNFGWVHIKRLSSGLEVQGSATALGNGIVAGTTTQVPEPSAAAALTGTIACVVALVLRRKQKRA